MVEISPRVSERFVTRASELGFSVPPSPLRLKLLEGSHHWSLFAQPVPAKASSGIAAWVETFAPLRVEFGSRHVIRADFDPLPLSWSWAVRGVKIDSLFLDAAGQALVTASGARASLAAWMRHLRGPAAPLDIRHVGAASPPVALLTIPQDVALRAAVECGYYLIPRPLNLRQLAKRLEISSASLSERLRRAEGRVLTRFVEEGGMSPWDRSTIYDSSPISSGLAWPLVEKLEIR